MPPEETPAVEPAALAPELVTAIPTPVSEAPADLIPSPEAQEPEEGSINWEHLSQELEPRDEDLDIPAPDILDTPPAPEPVVAEAIPTPPEPAVPPVAAVPEPAPAVPPVAEPAPVVPQVAEPALPTPEPTPVPEPVQQPQAQQPTDEQQAQLRTDYLNRTSQLYQLNQEQAGQMVTDPNAVLPQLAAALHVNILEQSLQASSQMLQQALPALLDGFLTQRETTQSNSDEFFTQWEELRPQQERVMQLATVYRQNNPQASKEQFFRDVGMQAWMALGMDTGQLAAKLQPQAPAIPGVPASPAPAAPVVATGLNPANPGAATPLPSATPSNPFADLAAQFAAEDADDF